ncbi:hypothetical protein BDR06DRAFT_969462 [Suillus hirtellus]|nr:hypothetical protein BDR06DRAFT_969462 [Suillus hirtellus]
MIRIRAVCQSHANLAGTSVNALVNADFSNNKLMVEAEEIAVLNMLALGICVCRQWKWGYHKYDLGDPHRDTEGDLALDFKTGTEVCSFVTTLMLSKKKQAQSVERNKDEKKEDKKSDDALHLVLR